VKGLILVLFLASLILPGFIRYVRLVFVPYIALFSKKYRADEADAVALSVRLSRGLFGRILFVLIAPLTISAIMGSIKAADDSSVVLNLLVLTAGFLVSVWGYALIFEVFEEAMENHREKS
jgi:hypothetical protein